VDNGSPTDKSLNVVVLPEWTREEWKIKALFRDGNEKG
jgi:hypothetical protein